MKKFRFALLALAVVSITFAFTKAPEKSSSTTYYAFDVSGNLLGSATSISVLKATQCPGPDQIFCAQVWTGMDANNHPAGQRENDLQKPRP